MGEQRVRITIDDREAGGSAIHSLKRLGVEVEVRRLPAADFIISGRVGVERKTAADFESSVIDGRLFSQARDLKENFSSPLICVVGKNFERLDQRARRGALISLAVDYNIPVFFLESEESLAAFLHQLAWREQMRPERTEKLNFNKRAFTREEQSLRVIEALPGVGPKLARELLSHFGSVENVFTAGEGELCEVEGIGEEKAREIRKLAEELPSRKAGA
ncbi:hypothetical protein HY995_01660 [Candidatus Micrarchaeota archaeon]|nr:hypothetical protein [Candidatus Micrarchaeota archaeon]MBI5176774.1 hypothetical protein [Candidatus Micrarchaeota archaeon]